MKYFILTIMALISTVSFSQDDDAKKEKIIAQKKANDYVFEGNNLVNEDFISAEMEYRKAMSEQPSNVAGAYNLGHSYYKEGNFDEALYRNQQAIKSATSKKEKHRAYHNIGNILMQNKQCKEAAEAFKNALRNDPADDETRYNFALAKECAEDQKNDGGGDDENKDKDQKKEDQKKDKEKKKDEGDNKEDKKDKGDKDKKEGDNKEDKDGKPKDEKKDNKGKGDDEKKQQQKPKPQPGKLSSQQIKNLLEAMNNKEQKVQEKINAKKQKGVKIKTEKDW